MKKLSNIEEGMMSQMWHELDGTEKREEEKTEKDRAIDELNKNFKEYLNNIEWVDLGHRDYFFEKDMFFKKPYYYEEYGHIDKSCLFNVEEMFNLEENLPDDITFMPMTTYWWLISKSKLDYNATVRGFDVSKVTLTKPGTDISTNLYYTSYEDRFATHCIRHDGFIESNSEYDYYMWYYFTVNKKDNTGISSYAKKKRERDYITSIEQPKGMFLFKLVKSKPRKSKK